jgi:hypothetical protein
MSEEKLAQAGCLWTTIPLVDEWIDGWVDGWTDMLRHLIPVESKKGMHIVVVVCVNNEITSTSDVGNIAVFFQGKKQPVD